VPFFFQCSFHETLRNSPTIDGTNNTADNSDVRILHISSARVYGGVEQHMAEVCRGLQERGHDVFVALRPTNEWEDKLSFLPEKNILHVSVRNPFGVLSGKRIAAFVGQHQIEIVHAHLPRDYFPGSLACNLAKSARFVLSRHAAQPLKPFNRFALKNLSKAIAVSKDAELSLQTVFPPGVVSSIPAGIDTVYFDGLDKEKLRREFREFHHIPETAFLTSMIGNLTKEGGQRQFILAASEIVKEMPEAHFAIVGTDNTTMQEHRRDLKRLTEVMGLEDRTLWLDHTEDSLAIFSASDVVVPCLNRNKPGREVLEAISLGKPVLVTGDWDLTGFCAVVDAVIRRPDALAIAGAVLDLHRDPGFRSHVVEQLQKVVRERYSIANTVAEIEKLYLELK
jgi:glycosyltransferase involved in cell wall biosynthesis